jgi:Fe-S-cluster containining protein
MSDVQQPQAAQSPVIDAPLRFFEWKYDANEVIEYKRLGECNGCGDCCQAVIKFFVLGKIKGQDGQWQLAANGGTATTGKGTWLEVQFGDKRRYFQLIEVTPGMTPCRHLTEDMRCDIHFTKPLLHKVWPMSPGQVTPFERCSYSFDVIARRPIAAAESHA